MMFRFRPYASGSTGNLYTLTDGQTSLIIEAGLPYKEIRRILAEKEGKGPSDYDACLISHIHKDHSRAMADMQAMGIDVIFGPDHIGEAIIIGTMEIGAFEVVHNVPCTGFMVKTRITGDSLVFITDALHSPFRFGFSPTIFAIECNYAEDLLEGCAYADDLVGRHMSLDTCIKTLQANDLSRTREIHLIHLSGSNSDEARFVNAVQAATRLPAFAAREYEPKR